MFLLNILTALPLLLTLPHPTLAEVEIYLYESTDCGATGGEVYLPCLNIAANGCCGNALKLFQSGIVRAHGQDASNVETLVTAAQGGDPCKVTLGTAHAGECFSLPGWGFQGMKWRAKNGRREVGEEEGGEEGWKELERRGVLRNGTKVEVL